jgi:hypothetical protein
MFCLEINKNISYYADITDIAVIADIVDVADFVFAAGASKPWSNIATSPTLPTSTLPASLAGISFNMTEALLSIGWRSTPPPPPKASLTLPPFRQGRPTPNQGLPTST